MCAGRKTLSIARSDPPTRLEVVAFFDVLVRAVPALLLLLALLEVLEVREVGHSATISKSQSDGILDIEFLTGVNGGESKVGAGSMVDRADTLVSPLRTSPTALDVRRGRGRGMLSMGAVAVDGEVCSIEATVGKVSMAGSNRGAKTGEQVTL